MTYMGDGAADAGGQSGEFDEVVLPMTRQDFRSLPRQLQARVIRALAARVRTLGSELTAETVFVGEPFTLRL